MRNLKKNLKKVLVVVALAAFSARGALSYGQNVPAGVATVEPARELAWSQAVLAVTTQADMLSSLGLRELNPVLSRGAFSWKQLSIGEGILAGVLASEHYALRRHPAALRRLKFLNWVLAGYHGGLAVSNSIQRKLL